MNENEITTRETDLETILKDEYDQIFRILRRQSSLFWKPISRVRFRRIWKSFKTSLTT